MPDSQSSEPGFESPFATISKIGHFRSLHWCPSWLSCINEYMAIESGGNVSDLVLARNCCLARMLPGEAKGQDYKEKHKTRLKTNVKRSVLNNTKLRHFWAQIVSWAPIHARKTFIILAPSWCRNEQVCQGRQKVWSALSGPTIWILRYIKTKFVLHKIISSTCQTIHYDCITIQSLNTIPAHYFSFLIPKSSKARQLHIMGSNRTV